MRDAGQLQLCSASLLNLDINAFKISKNCIPCDFLTFQNLSRV